jgi:hypothetical protein
MMTRTSMRTNSKRIEKMKKMKMMKRLRKLRKLRRSNHYWKDCQVS